jgi:hypothetical protein
MRRGWGGVVAPPPKHKRGPRKKKQTPLPDVEWGRHRKGALLHAWRDQRGSRKYEDEGGEEQLARYDRVTLCGAVDIEGHERPSRRGRRCKRCVARAADPRARIGTYLAYAWPHAITLNEVVRISNTKNVDRNQEALKAMETDALVFRSECGLVERWSARRALVEAHGRAYAVMG